MIRLRTYADSTVSRINLPPGKLILVVRLRIGLPQVSRSEGELNPGILQPVGDGSWPLSTKTSGKWAILYICPPNAGPKFFIFIPHTPLPLENLVLPVTITEIANIARNLDGNSARRSFLHHYANILYYYICCCCLLGQLFDLRLWF